MFELIFALGSVVGLLLALALLRNANHSLAEQHDEAMKTTAVAYGLTFHDGALFERPCTVDGYVDGIHVIIDTHETKRHRSRSTYTRFRLRDPKAIPQIVICNPAVAFLQGSSQRGPRLEIGDPEFDRLVRLYGHREAELRAVFGASTREAMRAPILHGWVLELGVWTLLHSGSMHDASEIRSTLRMGLEAAKATRSPRSDLPARLREVYTTDPELPVRIHALEARLRLSPPPSPAELHEIAADGGFLGLIAAWALGHEGLPYMYEALVRGDPPSVRLRAAERLIEIHDSVDIDIDIDIGKVQRVLLQAVRHEPYIDRAILGLEKIGTIEAVAPLLEYAEALLPSTRKTNAQRAVRAIQSRIAGADHGQVSIVTASGGELAEAPQGRRGGLPAACEQGG